MKYVFILLLCGTALAGCSPKPKNIEQAPLVYSNDWQTLDTVPYKGKRDYVSFSTPSHGWYGTGKGDLYATQNGGDTWELTASRPGTFIRALSFLDEQTGFIGNVGTDYYPGVTDETPLYRTDDGGKTWLAVELGGKTIKGVCAIDIIKTEAQTIIHAAGRVGGPTGILRSIDGGENWSVINMEDHAGMILDVKFFDAMTGLVFASTAVGADRQGLILRTPDGGQTWKNVYQSGRSSELIWKASFPDNKNGYATVQNYDQSRDEQLIVKTTDGGKTWKEIPLTTTSKARQFGIGFSDKDHGWVGTMAGGFYTADGGKTFTPAPVAKAANKFSFVPTEEGLTVYAIGTQVQKLELTRE